SSETQRVVSAVASLRGVSRVENCMEAYEHLGDQASLQHRSSRGGERAGTWMQSWSPAAKLVLGVTGGVVVLRLMLARGGVARAAVGLIGAGLAVGALNSHEPGKLRADGRMGPGHEPSMRIEPQQQGTGI